MTKVAKQFRKSSRQKKINLLEHLYDKDRYYSDLEDVQPYFSKLDLNLFDDELLDVFYNTYNPENNSNFISAPIGEGITVTEYRPLKLETYYPIVHMYYDKDKDKKYKWTGHSKMGSINKSSRDKDYNLFCNNCADETIQALEAIFNKDAGIIGPTTPGDARDFALENGGYSKDNLDRVVIIPMNKERYERLKNYNKGRIKNK